jgi:hypothetical protein
LRSYSDNEASLNHRSPWQKAPTSGENWVEIVVLCHSRLIAENLPVELFDLDVARSIARPTPPNSSAPHSDLGLLAMGFFLWEKPSPDLAGKRRSFVDLDRLCLSLLQEALCQVQARPQRQGRRAKGQTGPDLFPGHGKPWFKRDEQVKARTAGITPFRLKGVGRATRWTESFCPGHFSSFP